MFSSGVIFVLTVVKTDSNSGIVVHACADKPETHTVVMISKTYSFTF